MKYTNTPTFRFCFTFSLLKDSNLSKGLPVIKHVKHTKAFAYNYYFKVSRITERIDSSRIALFKIFRETYWVLGRRDKGTSIKKLSVVSNLNYWNFITKKLKRKLYIRGPLLIGNVSQKWLIFFFFQIQSGTKTSIDKYNVIQRKIEIYEMWILL